MPSFQTLFRRLLLLSLLGVATMAWAQANEARTGQFFQPLSPSPAATAKTSNAPEDRFEAFAVKLNNI